MSPFEHRQIFSRATVKQITSNHYGLLRVCHEGARLMTYQIMLFYYTDTSVLLQNTQLLLLKPNEQSHVVPPISERLHHLIETVFTHV